MTPHTLVGGSAQTTLSRQRPARARIVETADWPLANAKRDVDLEINKTHTPPLGALVWRAGATGAVGTGPKWLVPLNGTCVGKGLRHSTDIF